MKKLFLFLLLLCPVFLAAQNDVYLFSYFTKNGQDGLHFAYSYDGLRWDSLKNGQSFLPPSVGKDKLMRDPCILQAEDGTFHMVWTSGWWDKIIGYASSKDLIKRFSTRCVATDYRQLLGRRTNGYPNRQIHVCLF